MNKNIESQIAPLKTALETAADPTLAVDMAAYMRDQFQFLGVKSPQRKEIFKQYWRTHGPLEADLLDLYIRHLWAEPYREYHYMAQAVLDKTKKQHRPEHLPLFEELITTHAWWDTVDFFASHTIGDLFKRYPELIKPTVGRWRVSDNIWLIRTAILFQLRYKSGTDWPLLQSLAQEHRSSDEFFIQKGLGWALREYSKIDSNAVASFIETADLKPLTVREGLKSIRRNR